MFLFDLRTVNLIFQKKREIIVLLIYKVQLYIIYLTILIIYIYLKIITK